MGDKRSNLADRNEPDQLCAQGEEPADPGSTSCSTRVKLTVAYDGSNYQGWQTQKTGLGVQQVLESALAKLIPGQPRLHSSSRTDTGVHALGMVAHFDALESGLSISMGKLPLALNAHLPADIRVLTASRCPPQFHARFSASGKQYRYFIWNAPAMNPLLRLQAWHVPRALNIPAMRAAARHFIGKHDFASFAASREYELGSTARTLLRCDLKRSGPLLTFVIEGDGFLYKMCRGIVGTIVQVGLGKYAPHEIVHMLAQRDRRLAGMSAPAHGLVLWRVFYNQKTSAKRLQGGADQVGD
jgi:tRNA pseudouridine38-40 synthase